MPHTPFLQQIVADIDLEGQDLRSLKDHCYVFPTRRAGVYFKKYLTQRFKGQHLWAPRICSIVEFIELLTDRAVLSPITLVFELFDIYKNYEPEADFDSFYPWGQIILKDFDEIDKYLVDAPKLFSNLKDIKSIEEHFALPPEQLNFLRQFWNVLDKPKNTETEQEFIRIWEVLGKVYIDFQESLRNNHAAYEGLAQRLVLEQLTNSTLKPPFTKIVWAGFNALSTAEYGIIEHLCTHYNTTVYWDTDAYYMNNKRQEAGKFMRRYYANWQNQTNHNWQNQTNLAQNEVNIYSIGVPLRVGQAKYAGQLLQELLRENKISIPETAVVLGDEGMLFPMLYTLPPNIEAVNITMGYPLRDSPLYRLLETIVQMQKTKQDPNAKPNEPEDETDTETSDNQKSKEEQNIYKPDETTLFYSKFVLQLLQNPFIKQFAPEAIEKYIAYIAKYNLVYIYNHKIVGSIIQNTLKISKEKETDGEKTENRNSDIFKILFTKADSFLQLTQLFNDVLTRLFNHAKAQTKKETDINTKPDEADTPADEQQETLPADFMEMEFIYHLLRQLRILEETLRKYRQQITVDTFWKIFREVIQSVTLPFTGEPLRGLQIMGFLETRTLDFDNLFVLGLNEGIIPATKPHLTFIPFNLRKGFGLPTFLDQDAIFAYHFYHLLQRAKNVYLLYNTEAGNVGGNEKSRFLLQLEQEFASLPNGKEKLQKHIVSTPLNEQIQRHKIKIDKTPQVIEKLSRYLQNPNSAETEKQSSLSPTALSAYINCPVQFYLKYVAQLYELQNVNEELNNLLFGNILHRTIELLYTPYVSGKINQQVIENLLKNEKNINRCLKEAFTHNNFEHHKEGKNLLLKRVLKQLVKKVLENDLQDAPFTIIGLEAKDYSTTIDIGNGRQVVISGSIDRVDEVIAEDNQPAFRILDYKTGTVEIKDKSTHLKADIETYLADYFTHPDLKTGFQTYLYCYLFWVSQNKNARIKAGIYALRKLNEGIIYFRGGKLIDAELLTTFEVRLKQLLTEVFNPHLPFVQTEDATRYNYSPYQGLVGL